MNQSLVVAQRIMEHANQLNQDPMVLFYAYRLDSGAWVVMKVDCNPRLDSTQ